MADLDAAHLRDVAASGLQRSGMEYIQAIVTGELPAPPISELMGFRLVLAEPGRAVFEMEPGPQHYNPMGTVHGGVAADAARLGDGLRGGCPPPSTPTRRRTPPRSWRCTSSARSPPTPGDLWRGERHRPGHPDRDRQGEADGPERQAARARTTTCAIFHSESLAFGCPRGETRVPTSPLLRRVGERPVSPTPPARLMRRNSPHEAPLPGPGAARHVRDGRVDPRLAPETGCPCSERWRQRVRRGGPRWG